LLLHRPVTQHHAGACTLISVALTDFHLRHNSPVIPDPYYGNAQGFNHVLDLIEDACDGLLAHVVQQLDTDM